LQQLDENAAASARKFVKFGEDVIEKFAEEKAKLDNSGTSTPESTSNRDDDDL